MLAILISPDPISAIIDKRAIRPIIVDSTPPKVIASINIKPPMAEAIKANHNISFHAPVYLKL